MSSSPERTEVLKHKLAAKLEAQKWIYRKTELEFLEAGQHLRALNQIMWQVPGMAIAVTGGLWYGVTLIDGAIPRIGILLFAAIIDLLTICVIWRLRGIIEKQIRIQKKFAGEEDGARRERDRIVVFCWSFMLAAATLLSAIGPFFVSDLSKKKADPAPALECYNDTNVNVDALATGYASPPKISKRTHHELSKKQCP
ncbi:hypothetical protein [Paraburkholderia caledonica]|uniref:hypothetical protein n=1 Tax=Paraburkholderia caledonica TaxID=134536 RepID=UPI000DEF3FDD|nr:hypothetical protein [Paraburkholderia caledonica]AXF12986.1 hypothetical protein CUJ87_00030 [Paraburkholderia caledonica]